MKTAADVEQELIAPGGAFELTNETVLGESIKVFKSRDHTLREVLEKSANHGDNEYIVCEAQRLSFAEHLDAVTAVANKLRDEYDVQPGDRVAILADNHPEWIITFWATVSIGGICAALNGWWNRGEILYGLDNADPKLLVGDRKRLARIEGVELSFPVVCMEDDFAALKQITPQADRKPLTLPACEIGEDDPALILYTSGTTGRAKGALLSHRCLLTFLSSAIFSGFRMMILEAEAGKTSSGTALPNCGLFSAPLFHLSGLFTGVVTSLAVGMKTVWTTGRFEPEKILQLIAREKVTTWAPLGSMAARVLDYPGFDQYDVSSIIRLGSGGAPTSEAQQKRMGSSFSGTGGSLAVGYGLTESSGVGTHNWGELLAAHPNSVGRVFPAIDISIRDENNQPLAAGEQGEICIRGSCVMLGYWRNPKATAETIAPGRWLKTGDIGHFEGDFLFINTRARDLILRNAENIYPVEVEHCLELHADVREVAVIGVPHTDLGQEVKAFVVLAPDAAPTIDDLHIFCTQRIAPFKVPSHWELRYEPLPRNAAGKILKNVLSGEARGQLAEE